MFVGWIRPDLKNDIMQLSKEIACDYYSCLQTYNSNKSLCFGIYDELKLVGFISAFENEKSIMINNFCYTKEIDNTTKTRLISLLLSNLESKHKPVFILANEHEKELLEQTRLKVHITLYRAVYQGGGVAFHFSQAMAKSIDGEGYLSIANQLDEKAFGEYRSHYITDIIQRSSSLPFCTPNGYLHSYAMDSTHIKISPWVMKSSAYSDAEKLLRGVIYHRGLKKIIAFIPMDVAEITNLYRAYGFELTQTYYLMYLRTPPILNLEMIYAF